MKNLTFYVLVLFSVLSNYSFSQSGILDFGFTPTNHGVSSIAIQGDGKIIIGGRTSINNSQSGLVRVNNDGSTDATFNAFVRMDNLKVINTIAVQSDGKILIGGTFDSINGVLRKKIARLNVDGSLDYGFNASFITTTVWGANNIYVNEIKLQNDGKIVVGGYFPGYNQGTNQHVARLNFDGTMDSSFQDGSNANSEVKAITIQDDGKIILGGYFSSYNGTLRESIARIHQDGSIDLSFSPGSGTNDAVETIAVQQNGDILVGGTFSQFAGVPKNRFARLSADGTLDNSFVASLGNCYGVHKILANTNNKIYVAGEFTLVNGINRNYFVRLNLDGTIDDEFDIGTGFDYITYDIAEQTNGKIIVGGPFTQYNGVSRNKIVRLMGDRGVYGFVYLDFLENCSETSSGLSDINLLITPGNIVTQTSQSGFWYVDPLPAGDYDISIDTNNTNWSINCPTLQSFSVVYPDSLTVAPNFGLFSTTACFSPDVSIVMPWRRPCFTNQQIYVSACNEQSATLFIPNAYTIVDIDSNLIFESASIPYTIINPYQYRFDHGDIYPGECVNFTISAQVSCDVTVGQTICMQANLFPKDSCYLDSIPSPPTGEVTPCTLPWDHSSLSVEGWCANDSIYFTITNNGQFGGGDMLCYSPVRIYIDGVPYLLDSVMLLGGETVTYSFLGTGETWILQADQHPLHPGNSHPNAHVENCNPGNWTPDLVNDFPHNDLDPDVDIYCSEVTSSHDPNDKKGLPNGLTAEHHILPNQDLEYMIRFQNTGTDTAFTIVVRDTLDLDFDIFSVTPGVASHNYSFRMHGPRVLEWTFANILLPDSTTNEPASNGFLTFSVKQKPNLPDGTIFLNEADIYFDFNEPIITNETNHKVQRQTFEVNGVGKISKNELSATIFPNPTNGLTVLSFSKNISNFTYSLLDASGRTFIQKSNQQGKQVIIDMKNFPKGIYFVKIENIDSNTVLKLIVD